MPKVLIVLMVACFALAGCGGEEKVSLYPAKGKLLGKDGSPIKNVRVTFSPTGKDGKIVGASGVTNENGEFTLTNTRGGDGIAAGKFKVHLSVEGGESNYGAKGGADPSKKAPFPAEWNSAETTKKEVEVTEDGENNFEIKL
jgi:hypothetical protein